MANQYLILGLVKVDRGTIDACKHIAYWDGLVIQNQKTFKKEYLDIFNTEVLLKTFFEYKFNGIDPNLDQIIVENRQFIVENLTIIRITDRYEYIRMNNIELAPRNRARMERMAERMKTIPFNFE